MPRQDIDANGVVREYWNDTLAAIPNAPHANIPARSVRYYDAAGVPTSTVAFTAGENAVADAASSWASQQANRAQVDAALVAAMTSLQTLIGTTNATINTNPASYIKDIAQVVKRVIRAVRGQYDASN